jgi:hypothetical protein
MEVDPDNWTEEVDEERHTSAWKKRTIPRENSTNTKSKPSKSPSTSANAGHASNKALTVMGRSRVANAYLTRMAMFANTPRPAPTSPSPSTGSLERTISTCTILRASGSKLRTHICFPESSFKLDIQVHGTSQKDLTTIARPPKATSPNSTR